MRSQNWQFRWENGGYICNFLNFKVRARAPRDKKFLQLNDNVSEFGDMAGRVRELNELNWTNWTEALGPLIRTERTGSRRDEASELTWTTQATNIELAGWYLPLDGI